MKAVEGIDEDGTQKPLTDEIYRQLMPPEKHGRVRMMSRGVTPTTYFGTRGSSSHCSSSIHIEVLENEMAVMRNKTQEREEERQREIDDMNRQAQQKEDDREREINEMKREAQQKDEGRQRELDDMKRQL
ncbi:hypothetical protein FRX31_017427 [Thalictrum thalictroides]|uniref:Uncharacterized protein n=1 Tax=Thalictrum thalictroides TaxID=46969 RepID=A0A7J6W6I8_THATH|nr:hypothetical protein FRX31_017427 [Thalictrum thalictroides]